MENVQTRTNAETFRYRIPMSGEGTRPRDVEEGDDKREKKVYRLRSP